MKVFNKIMLAIVLIALTCGIGLFILTAVNPDLVYGWFGKTEEKPIPDPNPGEKPEGEEIKDFKFAGNKITGYLGGEVVLDNLPKSYSKWDEKGETFTVTLDDMMDNDKAMEIEKKLMEGSFYCKANGMNEKIYYVDIYEWEEKLSEMYKDITEALPMEIELLETTYYVGDDYQVNAIAENAFMGNTIITDVVVPEHIVEIGRQAFRGCTNLINVTLNENITTLNDWTFEGCQNLQNINLENITEFEIGVFTNCVNLENVTLNENLNKLSDQLFKNTGLTSIEIPTSVENIESEVFAECSNLTELVIPEGVRMIGRAFMENSGVEIIELPSTIESMFDETLNSSNLQLVKINFDIDIYTLSRNMEFSKAQFFVKNEIYEACFASEENRFMIKEKNANLFSLNDYTGKRVELKEITDYRFDTPNDRVEIQKYLGNEQKVVLPDYVKFSYETLLQKNIETKEDFDKFYLENKDLQCHSIEYMSHKGEGGGADNIETIKNHIEGKYQESNDLFPIDITAKNLYVYDSEIGFPVDYIRGREVFGENVREVVLGNTYESIGEYVFENSNLSILTLGENFNTIYQTTFENAQTEDLIIVNNSKQVINVLWSNQISNFNGKMYVRDDLFEDYITSEGWSNIANNIYPMSELNSEPSEVIYTFNNRERTATLTQAKEVETLIVPSNLTRAGVSYSVTEIGEDAFYKNNNLKSITISSSVKKIADSAFFACGNLESVIFEENSHLIEIGNFAFYATALTEISLPEGVEVVDNNVFVNCLNLTTIHLPSTLKTLGQASLSSNWTGGVFSGSYNISSITIGEGNTNFKVENNCLINTTDNVLIICLSGVTEVEVPTSVQIIMDSAFAGYTATKIILPEGVTGVGTRAFDNCQNLQEIVFPETITMIEDSESIIKNCPNLKTIKYLSTTIPPCFVNETIENIYVQDEVIEQFKQAEGWSSFSDKIHGISELGYLEYNSLNVSVSTILESYGNIKYSDTFEITRTGETYAIISSKGKVKGSVEVDKENETISFDYTWNIMTGKMTLNFKDMRFSAEVGGKTTSDTMTVNNYVI